jgi:hypothetical protein
MCEQIGSGKSEKIVQAVDFVPQKDFRGGNPFTGGCVFAILRDN